MGYHEYMSAQDTLPAETRAILRGHRITWWVYAGRDRIRKTATMRGTWGHDATCACGWDSHTGGATRGSVERDVRSHKYDVTGDWHLL